MKKKYYIIFKVPIMEILEIFCKVDCGNINANSVFRSPLSYRNKK